MEPKTHIISELGYEKMGDSGRMHIVLDNGMIIYNIVVDDRGDEEHPYRINYTPIVGTLLDGSGLLFAISSTIVKYYLECTSTNAASPCINRSIRKLTVRDVNDFDIEILEEDANAKKPLIITDDKDINEVRK